MFEAERSGHAAAARSRSGIVDPHAGKDGFLGRHLHDRFVMAMPMNDRLAGKVRKREIPGLLLKELAKQENLTLEPLCALIFRKKIDELVPENRRAARF